jgi:hypothetical protein
MFRKLCRSAAAVAVLVAAPYSCLTATAAEPKPVLTVSVSGLQELLDDVSYLGDLGGQPGAGQQIEAIATFATQGYGLEGIDRKRPWGATVNASEEGQFQVLLFVPAAKFDKLKSTIAAVAGEPEDAGDGVWEFATDRQSVFLKEKDGWAFFAQTAEALGDLPADPVQALGGLNTRYDIAAEVHVQNLPEPLREMFIDQLRSGMEAGMRQEEGESDEQYEARRAIAQQQLDNMSQMMNELDQVLVGWNVDRAAKQIYVDLATTAKPGSKAALQLTAYKADAKPSRFAGFLSPEAIFSLHAHSILSDEDKANADQTVAAMRQQASTALANDDSLGDEEKKLAERLIDDMLELAAAQLKSGSLSMGATVQGEGPINAVLGGAVADGALVEEKFKKWISFASQADGFPKVNYNVGEYEGVKFHTAAVEIPKDQENREKVVALLGEKIDVTVGIGKDSAFLAVGPGAMDSIKKVIDGSKKPEGTDAMEPVNMSLAVGKLLSVIAKTDDDAGEAIAKVADSLKSEGNDHVRIETVMIENGAQYRFLAEEGAVKGLIAVGKVQQQRQQNAFEDDSDDAEGDDAEDDDSEDDSDEEEGNEDDEE